MEVNRYIKTRTGADGDCVVYRDYADLQTQQQDAASSHKNKIIMSVVDIVQENINQHPSTYIQQGNNYIIKNLPINFFIYVLFASNYKGSNAVEGLRHLSNVISFFQSKNHFTTQNTPTLQATNLEDFSAFLVKHDHQQKETFWKSLHTPYMPSVVYKVGMIPISDTPEIWPEISAINKIFNLT